MSAESLLPAAGGNAPDCANAALRVAELAAPAPTGVPQSSLLAMTEVDELNNVIAGSERTPVSPKPESAGPMPRTSRVRLPLPGPTYNPAVATAPSRPSERTPVSPKPESAGPMPRTSRVRLPLPGPTYNPAVATAPLDTCARLERLMRRDEAAVAPTS